MRKFSKYVAAFVIVALLVSTCSMSAFAATNETVAVLRYTEDGETKYENYTSLNTALVDAASGDTVYVVGNAILATNGTVKTGVTLVVPTSENYEDDTTTGYANVSGNGTTGEAYRTLTIESGATLTVNGTLLVAGNQQSTQPRSGFLTGAYGAINLQGSIVVNGTLYARGEIYGNGTVTANNGGTVYQRFQIADWRSGTASRDSYQQYNVFPFNLYELGGISVTTVFENGSTLYGQAFIYASGTGETVTVYYIGDDGLLKFADENASADNITFTHNGDNTTINFNGDVATGDLKFSLRVLIFTYTISSAGLECPFGYHTDIVANDGASVTINSKLVFLPGCDVTVKEGATLTINSGMELNFFAAGTYKDTFYLGNAATWNVNDPAVLNVEDGATLNITGILSSSDRDLSNLKGPDFVPEGEMFTITEIIQNVGSTSITPETVDFYPCKLA